MTTTAQHTMNPKFKVTRIAPGRYEVTLNGATITVMHNPQLSGSRKWMWYANRNLVGDPVRTLATAIAEAKETLLSPVLFPVGLS